MDMWICRLEKKDKARAHGRDGQPREGQDPSTGEGGPDKRGITQAHGRTEDKTGETIPKRKGGRDRQERHDPSAGDAGLDQKAYTPAHGTSCHT